MVTEAERFKETIIEGLKQRRSHDDLAAELHVHKNTIQKCINQYKLEGIIQGDQRSSGGFIVEGVQVTKALVELTCGFPGCQQFKRRSPTTSHLNSKYCPDHNRVYMARRTLHARKANRLDFHYSYTEFEQEMLAHPELLATMMKTRAERSPKSDSSLEQAPPKPKPAPPKPEPPPPGELSGEALNVLVMINDGYTVTSKVNDSNLRAVNSLLGRNMIRTDQDDKLSLTTLGKTTLRAAGYKVADEPTPPVKASPVKSASPTSVRTWSPTLKQIAPPPIHNTQAEPPNEPTTTFDLHGAGIDVHITLEPRRLVNLSTSQIASFLNLIGEQIAVLMDSHYRKP